MSKLFLLFSITFLTNYSFAMYRPFVRTGCVKQLDVCLKCRASYRAARSVMNKITWEQKQRLETRDRALTRKLYCINQTECCSQSKHHLYKIIDEHE